MDIETLAAIVKKKGPHRVVVDREGEAKSPQRALQEDGVQPDVVFLRNDGWTLGAPKAYHDVALNMWREDWVGYVDLGTGQVESLRTP